MRWIIHEHSKVRNETGFLFLTFKRIINCHTQLKFIINNIEDKRHFTSITPLSQQSIGSTDLWSKDWCLHLFEKEARRSSLWKQSQHNRAFGTHVNSNDASVASHIGFDGTRTNTIYEETWVWFGNNPCVGIHGCFGDCICRCLSWPASVM